MAIWLDIIVIDANDNDKRIYWIYWLYNRTYIHNNICNISMHTYP